MAFLDILGAIASPISSLIGAAGSQLAISQQKSLAREQNAFQAAENEKNRQWQSDEWQRQFDLINAYNDPREQVKRLTGAGLNAATALSGSASASGNTGSTASAPSGGVSASPAPDYSGVITSGYRSMADIANAIERLTTAAKNSKELPYVGAKLSAEVDELQARMKKLNQEAEFTKLQTDLEYAFGATMRSKTLAKMQSEILLADAEARESIAKTGLFDEQIITEKADQLVKYAQQHKLETEAARIKALVAGELDLLRAQANNANAGAEYQRAQALTENELRPYRRAIQDAEAQIKGNESKISAATWKDVVEQARQAATAAGLANEEKVQDVLLKGKNLDYRDAQEVRNWIKTIQGFIPLTSSLPME